MVFDFFIKVLRQEEYKDFLKAIFIPWLVLVFIKSAPNYFVVSIESKSFYKTLST